MADHMSSSTIAAIHNYSDDIWACEYCKGTKSVLIECDMICMDCHCVDTRVMIIDESAERRTYTDDEPAFAKHDDTSRCKHALHKMFHETSSGSLLINLSRFKSKMTPAENLTRQVRDAAIDCCKAFHVDGEQIHTCISDLYAAAYSDKKSFRKVNVAACSIIYLQRTTENHVNIIADWLHLNPKLVFKEIENLHEIIRTKNEIRSVYGYLISPMYRYTVLVKEQFDILVLHAGKDVKHLVSKTKLCESAWGLCILAIDMVTHIVKMKHAGAKTESKMVLVILALAHRLQDPSDDLTQMLVSSGFVAPALIKNIESIWSDAVAKWPKGEDYFMPYVRLTSKRVLYGEIKNRVATPFKRLKNIAPVRPMTDLVSYMKIVRARIKSVMASNRDLDGAIKNKAEAGGIIHLCVQLASGNTSIKMYLAKDPDMENETRLKRLIEICTSSVLMGSFVPDQGDELEKLMVGPMFNKELGCARAFKPSVSPHDCFIPAALINWQ